MTDLLPGVSEAQAETVAPQPRLVVADMTQTSATSGKGDMLVVNREGKGSLPSMPESRQPELNAWHFPETGRPQGGPLRLKAPHKPFMKS